MPTHPRPRHPLIAMLVASWLAAAPPGAQALELADVAREGELRFLAVRPDPGAYWYESEVQISEASLQTGVVQLTTCHRALDPNQKIVIAFNPERVRDITVVSTEGVGRSEVQGYLVELADVKRGGSVCINLSSRALDRLDDNTWRLNAGPLMRRYLDGYLPMQARLAFRWPDGLLQVKATQPGEQPGVRIAATGAGANLDLVFAGRMRATVDLERSRP
jgi:predicted RNA-binding protein with TRAM domain